MNVVGPADDGYKSKEDEFLFVIACPVFDFVFHL